MENTRSITGLWFLVLTIVTGEILLVSPKSYTNLLVLGQRFPGWWGSCFLIFSAAIFLLSRLKALIRRTLYLNPYRNFLSKKVGSLNLAVNQSFITEKRLYHPFGHFWITVCTLTCLPWYDFVGRELIRYLECWPYHVCTTYSLWVRQQQKVTRDERNRLGANKRNRIRTRTGYFNTRTVRMTLTYN